MTKFLLALLLILSVSCGHKPTTPKEVKSPIERQHATTHRIEIYDLHGGDKFKGEAGHCSATAIGPNALLTAQHCFKNSNLIRVDNESETTVVVATILDGNDHVIYIVNRMFNQWAALNERPMTKGEYVHFWGNPGSNHDVYRSGYFDRMYSEKEIDETQKFQMQNFILPVFRGDSGSGIFDESGNVVAVVSMADDSANNLDFPLAFTQAQLDVVIKK